MNFKATFTGSENTVGAAFEGGPFKPGAAGVTFYPSVSEDGTLSWSNDAGLPNPEAVNIRGPKGEVADLTPEGIVEALGYTPVKMAAEGNGIAGQFAVSDGLGGIMWVTIRNGNGVEY